MNAEIKGYKLLILQVSYRISSVYYFFFYLALPKQAQEEQVDEQTVVDFFACLSLCTIARVRSKSC